MRIAIVAAVLALSGCVTVSDLETGSGPSYEVTVDSPSSVVYRRIVERTRECLQTWDLRVDADYFPDGVGRITLVATEALGFVLSTTRIEPKGAGTLVRVSYHDPYRTKSGSLYARPIREWANGRPGECQADEIRKRNPPDRSRTG